jgi:uncharacterized OB-fold protein
MTKERSLPEGDWMRLRCYACGHRLAFHASACPQCGEAFDGRENPKKYPATCSCERCTPCGS